MKKLLILSIFAALLCVACNRDEVITADPRPVITLDDEYGVYSIKHGKSLTISVSIQYAEACEWLLDNKKVATGTTYTFVADEVGTFYLTLRATNETGTTEETLRVEVLELLPPVIGFALDAEGVMTIAKGREQTFTPDILNGDEASFEWLLDGKSIATTATLTRTFTEVGSHALALKVTNEDGTATQEIELEVVNRLAGTIYIPNNRTVALGRTLYLAPTLDEFASPTFAWSVDGKAAGTEPIFAFTPTAEGSHTITLRVTDSDGYTATENITVTCCATEGTYRRAANEESVKTWNKVYEYTPAPGQFINEDKSGFEGITSPAEALTYAEKRLTEGKYLSLGGWGGYVVVGFDHSIANTGGDDFSVAGNMFTDSSEAGIVWVMQDTNGNGLPDDEWYELKGSEWSNDTHTQNYAVRYYRPVAAGMNVQWRDNLHGEGRITRNATHTHDYYYPAWLTEAHYTLYGSRLAANTTTDASGRYINNPYAWGYADNKGSDAEASADSTAAAKCYFKISNAVNIDGTAADLQYIDFVKVQTAINYVAGALGEISTEVFGFEDENL